MTALDLKSAARSAIVREMATAFGFQDCRIAKADRLDREAQLLEEWLRRGYHGKMGYMENHFDKRVDPRALVPGARSVIVLQKNYFPAQHQRKDGYQISKYAYGQDYHEVIRNQLRAMLEALRERFGDIQGRGFVDSAPVLEKAWAVKSGLGWMGKHSNVITRQKGSFYFLAVLITDLELAADGPVADHCGSCTACIDACPTDAITEPYLVEASKCISYYTIELKDALLPSERQGQFNEWIFGCDICQDVCPWNRFKSAHNEPAFDPDPQLLQMSKEDWSHLKQEHFQQLFGHSAVSRTGYDGLMRNIRFVELGTGPIA